MLSHIVLHYITLQLDPGHEPTKNLGGFLCLSDLSPLSDSEALFQPLQELGEILVKGLSSDYLSFRRTLERPEIPGRNDSRWTNLECAVSYTLDHSRASRAYGTAKCKCEVHIGCSG